MPRGLRQIPTDSHNITIHECLLSLAVRNIKPLKPLQFCPFSLIVICDLILANEQYLPILASLSNAIEQRHSHTAYQPISALSVSEKLVISFLLLRALLAGLLLQHTLHATICLVLEQPANIHWFNVNVSINHSYTKSHPHKFNYCDAVSTHKIHKSKVHAKHFIALVSFPGPRPASRHSTVLQATGSWWVKAREQGYIIALWWLTITRQLISVKYHRTLCVEHYMHTLYFCTTQRGTSKNSLRERTQRWDLIATANDHTIIILLHWHIKLYNFMYNYILCIHVLDLLVMSYLSLYWIEKQNGICICPRATKLPVLFQPYYTCPVLMRSWSCIMGNKVQVQVWLPLFSTYSSLVPRPLPDFISQWWRKIFSTAAR